MRHGEQVGNRVDRQLELILNDVAAGDDQHSIFD